LSPTASDYYHCLRCPPVVIVVVTQQPVHSIFNQGALGGMIAYLYDPHRGYSREFPSLLLLFRGSLSRAIPGETTRSVLNSSAAVLWTRAR